jgi:hypothetical protein
MKKLIALLLGVLMALSCVSALAEDAPAVKLGQVQYAAHGQQAFAVITVAVQDGTVLSALIDEYQVMSGEGVVGVPNSDAAFGANIVGSEDGKVLGSKRVNNAYYSGNMASRGGATQELLVSWQAIEAFVAGKTIAELELYAADKAAAAGADVISGATLADTLNYLKGIIIAANQAANIQTGHYTVYNKTGETVKELYLAYNATGEKGENLVGEGLADNGVKTVIKSIPADADGSHALTFTYVTESGRTGEFTTLSIEDVPMTLLSADAMTGATPLNFFAPAAE